eukprot:maker-scaffold_3-snap-gene-16.18-mRNA-1 protein AED:0.00 eAED:0.00 QI:344/1/1/1/1/1/4/497/310
MNATKGFIFLEPKHPIVESVIKSKLMEYNPPNPLFPIDTKVADFDGALYNIRIGKDDTEIKVTFTWDTLPSLLPLGAQDVLKNQYASYNAKVDRSTVTLSINPKSVVTTAKSIDLTTVDFALLKSRLFGAPLKKAFLDLAQQKKPSTNRCKIDLRQGKEQILISPQKDKVLVAFYINYLKPGEKDSTDSRIAEIFLSKFANKNDFGNAPGVRFIKDIPKAFKDMSGVISHPKNTPGGWVEFNVRHAHVNKDEGETAINLLLSLRQYLQYHIKATKAQLHQRMRSKVKSFLQVLNRARPDEKKEKKAFKRL